MNHDDDTPGAESAAPEVPPASERWATQTVPEWGGATDPGGAPLQHGLLVHRYELIEQIGAGGMAVVWSARDTELGREVAVKLIGQSGAGPLSDLRARLLREARAMARLSHPNVVTVHDVGATNECVFIVMERLYGGTLASWLRLAPRSWGEVLAKFIAAGQGLVAAHRAGLVHRDFKPENVLIDRDGVPRVSDFGLAFPVAGEIHDTCGSVTLDAGTQLTPCGAVIGTLSYMSPEQLLGQRATARSDQFSFCVALHEALFSTMPFGTPTGESAAGPLLTAIVEQRFAPVPPDCEVPDRLREVTRRGLAGDPNLRWSSMDVLLTQLELCARETMRPATAPPQRRPEQDLLLEAVSAARRAEALARAAANRPQPSPLLVLGILALALPASTFAWFLWGTGRDEPIPASEPGPLAPAPAAIASSPDAAAAGPDEPGHGGEASEVVEPAPAPKPEVRRIPREPLDRGHRRRAKEAGRGQASAAAPDGPGPAAEPANEQGPPEQTPPEQTPPEEKRPEEKPTDRAAGPARAVSASSPPRPITVAAWRARRESGGKQAIRFPSGEQAPRQLLVKICIDERGQVTSVDVISPVSPGIRWRIERALTSWRYQPIVQRDEVVAACFADYFPVQVN